VGAEDAMCFFFSFLPATIWTVLGYFVLFSSTRVEGPVRTFGRILSIWVFVVAALFLFAGAYVTLAGYCPMEMMTQWCGEACAQ
jgi:hypothetical protein